MKAMTDHGTAGDISDVRGLLAIIERGLKIEIRDLSWASVFDHVLEGRVRGPPSGTPDDGTAVSRAAGRPGWARDSLRDHASSSSWTQGKNKAEAGKNAKLPKLGVLFI